jgi:4'-phosphopantetheinyl transferase EntD
VGSITHCNDFCCAVVARSSEVCSLGIDVEENTALERSLVEIVCAPSERAYFSLLPKLPESNWEKLAFCAKEAFYKYFNPLTNNVLDFQEVSVKFSVGSAGNGGRFSITVIGDGSAPREAPATGAWLIDDRRIYAGVSPTRV